MLDQNTDRMWYVIGAVLIGAAIIFGFNTFMPNAFASVSNMFGVTTAETETVMAKMDYRHGKNILDPTTDDWVELRSANNYGIGLTSQWYRSFDEHDLKAGDTLTLSGKYKVLEDGKAISPRLMFTPEKTEPNNHLEQNHVSKIRYTDEGEFSFTTTVPENANYVTVRFNPFGPDGSQGIQFAVKHVKLEVGSFATPY